MRHVLCIVTSPEDPLTDLVVSAQQAQPDCSVKVFKLDKVADYEKLLDAIFEAESVQVW